MTKVIIGEDNLLSFTNWKNYERILEDFGLYVYPRPSIRTGDAVPPVTIEELKRHPNVRMVEAPLLDISATFIRECVRKKISVRYLVPDPVEEMITQKHFYR